MHGQCEDFASHPQGVINAPPRRFTMGAIRSQASGGEVRMPIIEYEPGTAFPGVVGRTADESVPAWPAPVRAREGAPNVLFIVLDDTGFGQLGCYGSLIATPSFDALAADGLRYSNMHTTALCSPSRVVHPDRAEITTATRWRASPSWPAAIPGYNGIVPFENGFLSEMLVEHGYNTFMVGKYHLTPRATRRPPQAPTTAGRSGAASSASTASSAATPASGTRTSYMTTTRSNRLARPRRVTT